MKKADINKSKLPDTPGVYFFLGTKKEILYIGKATSLRNRIASYFASDIKDKRSELIENMVRDAKSVEFTQTDSVLEALILETNLIRTHKPRNNTRSKDDKSYNHLIITNEEFPRVLVVRGKDLTERFNEADIQYNFGPFPNGQLFREALKIVRRIFQFYDTKAPIGAEKSKVTKGLIDFNRQIGLYPDMASKREYKKTIKHLRMFFEGKKKELITELKKEMMQLAKQQKFEQAGDVKKKIFALEHIHDIALIKDDARVYRDENSQRFEAYDIAHMFGKDMVGVMTVVEGLHPQKDQYRKFKIQSVTKANDTAALSEMLTRRLQHTEWPLPGLIIVDGSTAQKNAAEQVLKRQGITIPVVGVVKDAKHNPIKIIGPKKLISTFKDGILLANAEAHRFAITYYRDKSRKSNLT